MLVSDVVETVTPRPRLGQNFETRPRPRLHQKLRDRDSRLQNLCIFPKFFKKTSLSLLSRSFSNFWHFPTCFGCFLPNIQQTKNRFINTKKAFKKLYIFILRRFGLFLTHFQSKNKATLGNASNSRPKDSVTQEITM